MVNLYMIIFYFNDYHLDLKKKKTLLPFKIMYTNLIISHLSMKKLNMKEKIANINWIFLQSNPHSSSSSFLCG